MKKDIQEGNTMATKEEILENLKWVEFKMDNGTLYIGQCNKSNILQGRGALIYPNNVEEKYYVGYIDKNLPDTYGQIFNAQWQTLYEGEFENGKKKGFGKSFNYQTGNVYTGYFNNDLPNGQGVLMYKDNSRYEGGFLNGEINDKGYRIKNSK